MWKWIGLGRSAGGFTAEDEERLFENDESVTTTETHQTTHRWAAGKHSAVSRARGACALPHTVYTPEPDAKQTQRPRCARQLEMVRTHAATSPTDLRHDGGSVPCPPDITRAETVPFLATSLFRRMPSLPRVSCFHSAEHLFDV